MSGIIDTVGSKSGVVGSDVYPDGHVVQVLQYTNNYNATTTSAGELDFEQSSGVVWEPSITVTSGNKVLILAHIHVLTTYTSNSEDRVTYKMYQKKGSGSYAEIIRDYRSIGLYDWGGDGVWMKQAHTTNYLSSPNTGDLIKYKITLQADSAGQTVQTNYAGDVSNIILMEVTA